MENRILSLKLNNIKCVKNGVIQISSYSDVINGKFESLNKSSVLGLYGQNGSGKTTVYDCFRFLKTLTLPVNLYVPIVNPESKVHMIDGFDYLLNSEAEKGSIEYEFLINVKGKIYKVNYVIFLKRQKGVVFIAKESITIYPRHDNGVTWKYPFTPMEIVFDNSEFDILYDGVDHKERVTQFSQKDFHMYSSLFATKINCIRNGSSYILSKANIDYLTKSDSQKVSEFGKVISALKKQIFNHLFTYRTSSEGLSEVGLGVLLGITVDEKNKTIIRGEFQFSVTPFQVLEEQLTAYKDFVEKINIFVSSFVPNFKLDFSKTYAGTVNGKNIYRIEFFRNVGKSNLPISQESSGIRKLISIACAIIFIYGNPDGWLVVDEFDSGIFEELLGQIVFAIQQSGKGQLIFTAHNLRPLERLSSNSIMFTTSNPENRYINFKNLVKTNNLRDCYFRALKLGGQSEELSSVVNDEDIDLALFEAYKSMKKVNA